MEKVYGFRTLLPIDKIYPPFEAHDKKFYPFSVKGLYRRNGKPWTFNCLEPIPEKCVAMECTCSTWDDKIIFSKFKPK